MLACTISVLPLLVQSLLWPEDGTYVHTKKELKRLVLFCHALSTNLYCWVGFFLFVSVLCCCCYFFNIVIHLGTSSVWPYV